MLLVTTMPRFGAAPPYPALLHALQIHAAEHSTSFYHFLKGQMHIAVSHRSNFILHAAEHLNGVMSNLGFHKQAHEQRYTFMQRKQMKDR